jgi:hypothetical protein
MNVTCYSTQLCPSVFRHYWAMLPNFQCRKRTVRWPKLYARCRGLSGRVPIRNGRKGSKVSRSHRIRANEPNSFTRFIIYNVGSFHSHSCARCFSKTSSLHSLYSFLFTPTRHNITMSNPALKAADSYQEVINGDELRYLSLIQHQIQPFYPKFAVAFAEQSPALREQVCIFAPNVV